MESDPTAPASAARLLAARVDAWRAAGYPSAFAAVAELLAFQRHPDGTLRYLRAPQVAALETHLYLRAVLDTPRVHELSAHLRPIMTGFGESLPPTHHANHVHHANHEPLPYPSYILALAMGAGKTTLIAAVIACEFALGLEYDTGPWIRNALVFAPGKTIFGALREIARVPFRDILPRRHADAFLANVRTHFTRDGAAELPVVEASSWNLVVTNTEKISLRAKSRSKRNATAYEQHRDAERATVSANLRLQRLASLPQLAIFSDEAHHTYGPALDKRLKRVRQTVNYLAAATTVAFVVNTTGTPYHRRQLLPDVVYWYGLAQGIRDGILKDLGEGSVQSYELGAVDLEHDLLRRIVTDFFGTYAAVHLPDGAPARLAFYFPKIASLRAARPILEATLASLGYGTDLVLEAHNEATEAQLRAFDELGQTPSSPCRVLLLVNKGTEGWNCPSLFATALVRKLTGSNNFVLQAATRCLRQVPGNEHPARIYLTHDNRRILERELRDNFGESITELVDAEPVTVRVAAKRRPVQPTPATLLKPVVTTRTLRPAGPITLVRPRERGTTTSITHLSTAADGSLVEQRSERLLHEASTSVYSASAKLASTFRLEPLALLHELRRVYPEGSVPQAHLTPLARQLEGITTAVD